MAAQYLANFILGRMRISRKIVGERHQDAGRTEAALQRMMLLKRLLQCIERAIRRCQRLDRRYRAAFGLHGEREAAAHCCAIDEHGAAAAHAVLAAHMGSGCPNHVTQEIGKEHAGLRLARHSATVEREADSGPLILVYAAHRKASSTTAGPSRRNRSRRSRADAC